MYKSSDVNTVNFLKQYLQKSFPTFFLKYSQLFILHNVTKLEHKTYCNHRHEARHTKYYITK